MSNPAFSPSNPVKVGIIGAAGLSAGKLMELLLRHPAARLHCLVSESAPGRPLAKSHPALHALAGRTFDGMDFEKLAECDVIFSAKRHGETFPFIEQVLGTGAKVIDLSGDFRLKNPVLYDEWYGLSHAHPALLAESVYGLPEIRREAIRTARLIANPGCYTTTTILALAPFARAGLLGAGASISVSAISGVSGAGRNAKPENQFLAVSENVRPYRVGNHQHTPEIEQELSAAAPPGSPPIALLFVPHVGPYAAGILADCFITLAPGTALPTPAETTALLREAYAGEPFARVLDGAAGELPEVAHVAGSNFCLLAATVVPRTRQIVVHAALDNLIKGAAGQAMQNMNILFSFDETAGL